MMNVYSKLNHLLSFVVIIFQEFDLREKIFKPFLFNFHPIYSSSHVSQITKYGHCSHEMKLCSLIQILQEQFRKRDGHSS